jgi:AcrR family transcriptional regulator
MKAGNEVVKKRIRDNVWVLLNKYGHKGWNMDNLAKLSGVAKNTLYKIVGSKEALISSVVLSVQDEYIATVEHSTKSDNPRAAMYALVDLVPQIFGHFNFETIRELRVQYPSFSEEYRIREERMTEALIKLYQRGLDAGFVRKDIDIEFFTRLQRIVREEFIDTSNTPEEMAHNLKNALIVIMEGVIIRENPPC